MTAHEKTGSAARVLWFGDNLMTIRVPASAENDGVSIIQCRMPRGGATPLHVELSGDDIIHILEGSMRFQVDGKAFLAHAGQTVMAPKGMPHTFRIESAEGASCLVVTQGGEFEQLIREMSLPEDAFMPQAGLAKDPRGFAHDKFQVIGAPLP